MLADVRLTTLDKAAGSPLVSVLSLYEKDPASFEGFRLLAQSDGTAQGGDARIDRTLTTGTYYVAVAASGGDNWPRFRGPNAWRKTNRIRSRACLVYRAAASAGSGSSIVPLNFGSSRSTPKLSA